MNFQIRYQKVACPFSWKFTRKDLKEKLKLVSDNIIKQVEPSTSQDLINQKYLSVNQNQESTLAYVNT